MGWITTLNYIGKDPITASTITEYLFEACNTHSRKFILPLSHDEVVHGKRSIRADAGDD